ncbi:hypothetical protein GPJ56_008419 [Histomonas meleagridis]|uniref:uncharacterized protein n=1 Tax=Histomonas meleagridis TaxID=135588 RepID=UPI0035593740|nr:hypothetical protein GPJ56_008419 [Histomonas meleagridis]KAH0806475.1 hypothetical protein GO595_000637 [Histomonas meleagridis]
MLISFAPIELFFAILALIIYKCCPNKIAFKVFVWLAAVFSLAPIITHAAAIPQTSPQKCYHIYNHTFEYKKPDVADGCFGANVLNTSILPFYILTHLLVLIQIIMKDYGFSNQADVSSQPIANEKDQYYAEKPSFQLPPQQPAPAYSQFY